MARTITSANTVITLSILPIYPAVTLQQFATDDISDIPAIKSVETMMGADGKLAYGFVPVPVEQTISFMADSISIDVFEQWYRYMKTLNEAYPANGVIIMPGLNKKYVLTKGLLTSYKPISDAKKVQQSRSFGITWESVVPTLF